MTLTIKGKPVTARLFMNGVQLGDAIDLSCGAAGWQERELAAVGRRPDGKPLPRARRRWESRLQREQRNAYKKRMRRLAVREAGRCDRWAYPPPPIVAVDAVSVGAGVPRSLRGGLRG